MATMTLEEYIERMAEVYLHADTTTNRIIIPGYYEPGDDTRVESFVAQISDWTDMTFESGWQRTFWDQAYKGVRDEELDTGDAGIHDCRWLKAMIATFARRLGVRIEG